MNANSFIDVWREKNPHRKLFFGIKPNGRSRSRIDLWLATPDITNLVANVSISAAPLTDHCVIEISLKPEKQT